MRLPTSKDVPILASWKRVLEQNDQRNIKRDQDIHLSEARLILYRNGKRYALEIDDDEELTVEKLD